MATTLIVLGKLCLGPVYRESEATVKVLSRLHSYLGAQSLSLPVQLPCLPRCVPWSSVAKNATLLLIVGEKLPLRVTGTESSLTYGISVIKPPR